MSLADYLKDLADSIRAVKGTTDEIPAEDYSTEIRGFVKPKQLFAPSIVVDGDTLKITDSTGGYAESFSVYYGEYHIGDFSETEISLSEFDITPVDGWAVKVKASGASFLTSEFSNGIAFEDYIGLAYSLSSDGTYYICDGIGTETSTEIVIKDTINGLPVKKIESYVFRNNQTVTSVVIGNNITSAGSSFFQSSKSLKYIYIGDSLTDIATNEVSALECIEVSSNNKKMYSIDGVLYKIFGTKRILHLYPAKKGGETFTVPNDVQEISDYAFQYCETNHIIIGENIKKLSTSNIFKGSKIYSLTLPNTLTKFSLHSLGYCTNLTDIYYAGAIAEWEAITTGSPSGNVSFTVHCTDGDITV